ncbi:MAG: hypothetical protein L6R00_06425 [Phycisphaerae bacterium]|nr:hypothetical protein [Phycisphaerae bacterium]
MDIEQRLWCLVGNEKAARDAEHAEQNTDERRCDLKNISLEDANAELKNHEIVPYGNRFAVAYWFEPPYDGGRWECASAGTGLGFGRTPQQAVMAASWDGGIRPNPLFRSVQAAYEYARILD